MRDKNKERIEILKEIKYVIRRIKHRISRADMLIVNHKNAYCAYHPNIIHEATDKVEEIYEKELVKLLKQLTN